MNIKRKVLIVSLLMLAALCLITGCGLQKTPYQTNDKDNYTVSVKFDANGGNFAENTPVLIDSFDISQMQADGGKVNIPLLETNHADRAKPFTAARNGYFLAGWYAKCTENSDGTFTYAEPWDFAEDRLTVDVNGTYSSAEPVLTLYAAWVPLVKVEFYNIEGGEKLGEYAFDPNKGLEIALPAWSTETGTLNMNEFPTREGYTFVSACYDEAGKNPVEGEILTHPAQINLENATVTDGTLKLYTLWRTGNWYRIYTAEQFAKNFEVNGNYELLADLDFENKITWPTDAMHGSFSGIIEGNGHKISNVTFEQKNNSKLYTGLFGNLTEKALLNNITFESITMQVNGGTRVTGASFGLLSGTISADARVIGVQITEGVIQIGDRCNFATDDYAFGLVCGNGSVAVDSTGITCELTEKATEKVSITVEDGTVRVTPVTE